MSLRNEGLVEIEKDGRTFKGEWKIVQDMITVRYAMMQESTQLGREPYPPTSLARRILSELVDKYLVRSC